MTYAGKSTVIHGTNGYAIPYPEMKSVPTAGGGELRPCTVYLHPLQHTEFKSSPLSIHSTAFVDPDADLGDEVTIGPFAVIEAKTRIGNGCNILGHAQILAGTHLGDHCTVAQNAVIGGTPQDLGFDASMFSGVRIGAENVLRENVTIHRSSRENENTVIGDNNYFMAGSHAGHDCIVGDGNVLANNVLLAGHVELGNHTFLGGGSGFHQFIRIGDRCMVKGLSGISQDVPPFTIVSGENRLRNLNVVGLRRAGVSAAGRANLKEAFHLLIMRGLPLQEALKEAEEKNWEPEALQFIEFFRGKSAKGICRR